MRTLSALITTTWSPESRYGVKVGLSLPISMRATLVARRPSTTPVASTTNQFAPTFSASASSPLATYVLIALSHTFPVETIIEFTIGRPLRQPESTIHRARFILDQSGVDDKAVLSAAFTYGSTCAKNRGGLRNFVACSKAYASLINTGSLHARPKNEMPTGKP